jgi:hypothetical protein
MNLDVLKKKETWCIKVSEKPANLLFPFSFGMEWLDALVSKQEGSANYTPATSSTSSIR